MTELITFFIGIISAFIGSTVGGGGLIATPFLIFLGLPPHVAIATSRLGGVGMTASSTFKYWKNNKIIWKYIPAFLVLDVIGAYLGARILIDIDKDFLLKLVGIIIFAFVPIILYSRRLGLVSIETTSSKKNIGYIFFLFVSVFSGFFGAGGAIFSMYILMFFFGMPIIQAKASDSSTWFVAGTVTVIIFALNGFVNWQLGIFLLLGMIIGGYIGAHTAIKKGNAWVKSLFVVMIIASAIKLLFF